MTFDFQQNVSDSDLDVMLNLFHSEKAWLSITLIFKICAMCHNSYDFNQQTQLHPCHQDSPGPLITAQLLMIVPIALPLDSLLLRGVSTGPCFCFRVWQCCGSPGRYEVKAYLNGYEISTADVSQKN